jgi:thioredoxin reductase
VRLDGGGRASARKLLLATGVTDELPEVSGLRERFGVSVFHCPYCDGWEVRDEPLAAYGTGREGADLALELTGWSRDVVLCTGGPPRLSEAQLRRLARRGVAVREEPVAGLEGRGGRLERVRFKAGDPLPRRALFLTPRWKQRSDLAARLGCRIDEGGLVEVEGDGATSVPGVYAAGDTSGGLKFAVGAASAGAEAAVGINAALLREELAPKGAKAAR